MGHEFLADFMLGPAMRIDRIDADKLADKWCNWRQYYPNVADGKSAALVALIFAVCVIEFPRISIVLSQRRAATAQRAQANAGQKQATGKIVPMTGPEFRGV